MKLLDHMMKKAMSIHEKLTGLGKKGLKGVKKAAKKFSRIYTDYRFFARTKVKKSKAIKRAVGLAKAVIKEIAQLKIESSEFKALSQNAQKDISRMKELGPKLLSQILYWLKTGKVAQDKIISLWKSIPGAIPKGKIGKTVEFGRKWIINCYSGGYVLLAAPENAKISDQHCVTESLNLHFEVFGESPITYGTDRGMWSEENIFQCQMAHVKKIGIQPKGKAKPMVSQKDYKRLKNRRAGIEPRIGHLKLRGLGRSPMKSDIGDLISGYRSALSYNLALLMRDMNLQVAN